MTNNVLHLLGDAGQGSYEKFQQLHRLNYKTLQRLTALQFSLLALGVENAVQQARALGEVDDYANLLATETEIAHGYQAKFTNLSREASEFLAQSRADYASLAGQYFSTAQEKVQAASTTAKKKPRARKQRSVKKAA